jgi:hypothetical protein
MDISPWLHCLQFIIRKKETIQFFLSQKERFWNTWGEPYELNHCFLSSSFSSFDLDFMATAQTLKICHPLIVAESDKENWIPHLHFFPLPKAILEYVHP